MRGGKAGRTPERRSPNRPHKKQAPREASHPNAVSFADVPSNTSKCQHPPSEPHTPPFLPHGERRGVGPRTLWPPLTPPACPEGAARLPCSPPPSGPIFKLPFSTYTVPSAWKLEANPVPLTIVPVSTSCPQLKSHDGHGYVPGTHNSLLTAPNLTSLGLHTLAILLPRNAPCGLPVPSSEGPHLSFCFSRDRRSPCPM